MNKILLSICALLCIAVSPVSAQDTPKDKITVVVSFSILADMVKQVAGDNATVISLVPAGGDAHVYSPTPANAKALADAKIVIVNGLGFEGWMDRLVQTSGYPGRLIEASRGVTPLTTKTDAIDPHAWQSISNGKIYVKNITDALVTADPANAAAYLINSDRYQKELSALDIWVQRKIVAIPESARVAIVSHDSLQYFAKEYGVNFIAPLGVSTAGDANAGDIARLIDQIRALHIRAVFMENMTDPRLVQQLAKDGGAVVGGTLYSDSLSEPSGPAPTYEKLFRYNVLTLTKAMMAN